MEGIFQKKERKRNITKQLHKQTIYNTYIYIYIYYFFSIAFSKPAQAAWFLFVCDVK